MNWGNWTKRYFRPAIEAAGLSLRPYDLRHAYASLMIQAGESVIVVAARMGHSRPSMTLDVYAHDYQMKDAVGIATPDEMVDLARAMDCESFVPTANLVDISSHRKERNAC
jgi:integrase